MSDELKPGSKGEHELQEFFGTASRAKAFYDKQMLPHLSEAMIEYVARQDLMFIATADAHGECDCSLRAGEPGFVKVLDPKTVVYPELRGNGVMASLGNIRENPHVALAFFDFCASTVGLHINGRARIAEESPFLDSERDEVRYAKRVERWVVVDVIEAYIHCSKHVPLMKKLDKSLDWGTDDVARKGGDFFLAKRESRPWVPEPRPTSVPPPASFPPPPMVPVIPAAARVPQLETLGLPAPPPGASGIQPKIEKPAEDARRSSQPPDVFARLVRAFRGR